MSNQRPSAGVSCPPGDLIRPARSLLLRNPDAYPFRKWPLTSAPFLARIIGCIVSTLSIPSRLYPLSRLDRAHTDL